MKVKKPSEYSPRPKYCKMSDKEYNEGHNTTPVKKYLGSDVGQKYLGVGPQKVDREGNPIPSRIQKTVIGGKAAMAGKVAGKVPWEDE